MKVVRTASCIAALALASTAHGSVVLQDTYTAGAPGNGPSDLGGVFGYELTAAGFTAAGTSKLVLVYTGHDGNVAGTPNVTSVTYDGVALTEAIQDTDNGAMVHAGVWYLDNPTSDGTLRIELNSNTTVHYGFGLYAVDGLAAGVADTGTARSNAEVAALNHASSLSTSEGFFVQEAARNNQSFAETGGDDYLTLYNYSVDSYRGFSQYRVVTDGPGTYQAPVGNTGDNFKRVVSASFDAVPEPSSLALLGLGGLLIARRRRG